MGKAMNTGGQIMEYPIGYDILKCPCSERTLVSHTLSRVFDLYYGARSDQHSHETPASIPCPVKPGPPTDASQGIQMLRHALRSLEYQNSLIEVSEGACAEVTCEGRGV